MRLTPVPLVPTNLNCHAYGGITTGAFLACSYSRLRGAGICCDKRVKIVGKYTGMERCDEHSYIMRIVTCLEQKPFE